MITAYFLIAAFFAGWTFGSVWQAGEKLKHWQRAGLVALCIAWPYYGFVCWKVWRARK